MKANIVFWQTVAIVGAIQAAQAVEWTERILPACLVAMGLFFLVVLGERERKLDATRP